MWPFSDDGYALWNPSFGTHEVGGLRDTVQLYNAVDGSGTGFSFNNLSGYWFNWAVDEAWLSTTMTNRLGMVSKMLMTRDFSWDTASQRYNDLYQLIMIYNTNAFEAFAFFPKENGLYFEF